MKLLTVTVPCYNSESYMDKCLESLLAGGDNVEIIIVDDGSTKDRTPEIADEYAAKYPNIVKVIHQENKGHGGAVNTGIENATGLYFKVVDSDDWVDEGAFLRILKTLENIVKGPENVDVFIANHVYEKVGKKKKKVMRFVKSFPQDKIFKWEDMDPLDAAHYVLMHDVIYRTEILRESKLRLPEHTFYVDNIYAFVPFSKVKTLYYTNENLYRYYIGRGDQSVNEQIMMSRIDQQINVNNIMIDYMSEFGSRLRGKKKKFMAHELSIIMVVTSVLLMRIGNDEALQKKKELWKRFKEKCPYTYKKLRYSFLGQAMLPTTKMGRKLTLLGYKICNKIYGFN
ncbi:MAG TPA: glycosyltransferase family 2 protein [Candidatus Alectryocaccobium stercorigallinarum]|nr:glycosyltransferase family 2 protein [Candidatus Alectryocaccobium stercorigallinarum]